MEISLFLPFTILHLCIILLLLLFILHCIIESGQRVLAREWNHDENHRKRERVGARRRESQWREESESVEKEGVSGDKPGYEVGSERAERRPRCGQTPVSAEPSRQQTSLIHKKKTVYVYT